MKERWEIKGMIFNKVVSSLKTAQSPISYNTKLDKDTNPGISLGIYSYYIIYIIVLSCLLLGKALHESPCTRAVHCLQSKNTHVLQEKSTHVEDHGTSPSTAQDMGRKHGRGFWKELKMTKGSMVNLAAIWSGCSKNKKELVQIITQSSKNYDRISENVCSLTYTTKDLLTHAPCSRVSALLRMTSGCCWGHEGHMATALCWAGDSPDCCSHLAPVCLKDSSCLEGHWGVQSCKTNWFLCPSVAECHNWFLSLIIKLKTKSRFCFKHVMLCWVMADAYCCGFYNKPVAITCYHPLKAMTGNLSAFLTSVQCGFQKLILMFSNGIHSIFFQNMKAVLFHPSKTWTCST